MKCKKCGKHSCEHCLSVYLGIKFPCESCRYNKPIGKLPFCTFPSQHGRLDCPFLNDDYRKILEKYKNDKRKEIDEYDDDDEYLDNLVEGIVETMRSHENERNKQYKSSCSYYQ